MTGDKRIQDSPWQGRIAVLLLLFALIAVPAVALGGTDLPSNTTEPTAGVPDEIPPSIGAEENGTPEPTPTETVAEEVTPEPTEQLPEYVYIDEDIANLGAGTVIPSNSNVLLQISNGGNARFNDYGNNTYHFFSPGQSGTQGMNALHITTDPAESSGQVTFSSDQAGVFYLTDTGGRGWDDDGILMLAVNGTIPDSFRVTIKASGYQWTPVLTGTYPTFDDVTYVPEALNETFTKDDFLYEPQIWRPCAATNYPIFDGQDMTDTTNTFSILFIDLNAGILGANALSQPSFAGQSVTDNGAIKVEYSFENLPTFAAFDAYAYTVSSNQGQGIRWTNRLSASGSSGYAVIGQPLPDAPTADFTANVTSGEAPLDVLFTDVSTGTVASWAWDFENDGVVDSTEQNPTHTYTAAGTYSVNLTVANAGGSDSEVKTGYITVTEPAGPSVLPGYNNIFVKVANDLGAKYNAFDNNTYNIRFEGIGRGLNALHISTDPAVNFGQVTVTDSQTGTFYATDSGGKGYEDEIILMVAVNGTIPDDFRLRITADGYTWTPNPASNQPPSLDNVIYQASSLDEVFTKEDFIYGPQIWKPTGNEADYPIYAGQDMTNTENTFRIMFIDLNAGVLRPNETLENRGAVRITYAFENLESFAAFNVYAYCKNSNNGDDMIAWGNALTSDKAMSGYSVIGTDADTPAGSAWPMYGHDLRHTGLSPYTGPEFPVQLWSHKASSAFYVQPVLGADGTVYAGSRNRVFYAINSNGTLKWSYTVPNQIYTAAAIDNEGTVYFGNKDAKIYAVNPDGTLKWTFTTGSAVSSAPAIGADGTIYAGSGDMKLYAVNPDGTEKWSYATGGAVSSAPAIGADGTIYVGSADTNLYAINPDGSLKWSYTTGGAVNTAPAIGADGTIYTGSADGSLYAINPDGTPKWSYATGGAVTTPAIGPDGTIYAGSASKTINAVNPDGTLKWFYTTTGTLTTAPAIDAAGTVYIASSDRNDRYLYAIRSDGTLKWKFLNPVSPRFFDAPSIGADGTIYIGSSGTQVHAIGSTDAPAISSITIDPADIELSRGLVQQFLALATDTSGTVLANLVLDWSSSNETVGTVNATGFFTALEAGTTNLSATYGSTTGTANITVIPPVPVVKAITVSPAEKSVFVGDNWTFAATPLDQYSEPMDGVLCTWTSSNTTVGTVDETGNFSALIAGTTTVTAANGTVSGNATVTVLNPAMLTAITILPSPASLTVGEGLQFNATAVNQYNTTIDGLVFTWTCSDTSVGTVNETGYFTSLTYGRANVTAAIGAANATAPVTVLPQSPRTWSVDDSGGANFTSIQAAVDAAFDGDTIVVGDGMYSESVTVTKPLTLRSENGPEKTKIAPTSTYGVTVLADNSTVSGFGISGTSGINCRYYSGCTLTDNIIAVSKTGIYVQGANNILVDGNVINGSTTLSIALMCASICDSVISNNTCRDSAQGLAIQTTVQSSAPSNITVTGNVIASNNYGLFLDGVENSRFDHNIVTGNTYGIRMQSGPSNTLFANTVVNNSNTLDYPSGQANTWSSPDPVTYTYNGVTYTGPIGNYWGASYPIDDMNDNGIGDAGIALYTNNVDNYPLVLPAGAYFGEPYDSIPIPTTMEVSPSSVVMIGETQQQFTGTVYDQNGRVMTGAGFAWSSSDEKVGPITGGGLFTAVYAGNTTITGQCYTLRDTADVFVNRTVLETVWIDSCESTDGWTLSNAGLRDDVVYEGSYSIGTPKITANASAEKVLTFPEGAAQMRFQLYGVKTAGCWIKAFIDGEEVAVATNMNRWITYAVDISGYEARSHTFAVETLYSNPAGYSNQGVGFYLDQIEMRVNASAITPGIASIAVEPASANLTNGETQQFSAVAYDAQGTEVPDVSFAWSSSNTSVGSLSETGLFTARKVGTTTVTAAYSNATGTATVTVTPPQGDQTQNTPLDIPGCNVTTGNDGRPQVSINTTAANATVAGNTIRIAEGNFTLTIETEGAPTNESGTVNGTIANIRLDTNPVVTELGSVGTVSASVSANLTGIPQGAGLTTTVSQNVSADAQSAFQLAATADGLNLGDVAYTLNIVRTNLENGQDIAGATIRMAVSPAWVTAHGGVDAIRIIRSAEDGTKEVLATTLVGTDADGNIVFEAVSPNGLSIFGLAAATAASQPTQASSSSGGSSGTATAVGAASNLKPGESTTLSMDATAISAVTLTANAEVKDLMVTVAKGSLPQAAEPPAGTVYQYVQTTLYRASADDFSGVKIRFAVPATWLTAQGHTAEQVTLFRYADGAWQAVPVEALGEENGNAIFSADTNGFGLFAIAATGEAPGATGDVTPQPTATGSPAQAEAAAQTAGSAPTPQASPLPVWAAILAFGFLLFVRRT
ncbi:PQQ-binding-like beta-propeller repeat protein [Methanoculleus sp. UBA430]|uniref:Ig-like domain-containing protein n=1 Tax=Methanoculleus sp. UBA430 TaxID=1915511 RepID=UPI0025F9FD9C|nr:PQQ-binding-like beta-propeller repeat protein [Methanoculleus sp. UBA430]